MDIWCWVKFFSFWFEQCLMLPCYKLWKCFKLEILKVTEIRFPSKFQFSLKISQKVSLRRFSQNPLSFQNSKINSLLRSHSIVKNKPRTNCHESSSTSGMAMNSDFSSFLDDTCVEYVHNFHHLLESGRSHVLPKLIFKPDVATKKELRVITETNHGVNSISTIRVLRFR